MIRRKMGLVSLVMAMVFVLAMGKADALSVKAKPGTSMETSVSKEEPYPQEHPVIKQAGIVTYSVYNKGESAETALPRATVRINKISLIQQKGQTQNKRGLEKFQGVILGTEPMVVNPTSFKQFPEAFSLLGQVFDDMVSYTAVPTGLLPDVTFPGLENVKAFYAFVDSEYGLGYVNVYILGRKGDDLVQISGTTQYQNEPALKACSRQFEFKPVELRESCYFDSLRQDTQLLPIVQKKVEDLKGLIVFQ